MSDAFQLDDVRETAATLEERRADYLGYIVVRPLDHAPISRALVS